MRKKHSKDGLTPMVVRDQSNNKRKKQLAVTRRQAEARCR